MADELKTFRVYFKDGKSIVVRAHSFNENNGAFYKSEGEHDPDIFVRIAEVVAITPEPEREEAPTGGSMMSW